MKTKKIKAAKKRKSLQILENFFWFLVGAFLAIFFIASIVLFVFQQIYKERVFPGIIVNGVDFGGKTKDEVLNTFSKRNDQLSKINFTFTSDYGTATVSGQSIEFGFNEELLAEQAFSIGRSSNNLSNLSLIIQAYVNGLYLPASYGFSEDKLKEAISPLVSVVEKEPVDALFTFENGRVTAFQPSEDGQTVDLEELNRIVNRKTPLIIAGNKIDNIEVSLPVKVLEPEVSTDEVNDLGIRETIGIGTSLFYHSIPSRIFNVTLAASKLNGILVKPGEVFSFNKALGDVSALTGFQQAYIIKDGRTVLGDGGGVCQVSTTLFRAVLNAGLPITERHAHAYRVSYYEEDMGPGFDATVFSPSVDFKFKNDTDNYILIQTYTDPTNLQLTFYLYGTKDGREATISKAVVSNQSPPPPPLYQDDPTLAKDVVKQVDFPAWGARAYFIRKVVKDGKTIIDEKFSSNYRPWQAIYLKGTKE